MKIYVLRHGETSWNRQRLLQGRSDVELNENGRKLAKETSEGMADIPFEISFGANEGKAWRKTDDFEGDPNIYHFFNHPEQYRPVPDAESLQQLAERTADFMNDICYRPELQDKTILVSTHGAATRGILNSLRTWELSDFWGDGVAPNCGVAIIECKDGVPVLLEQNKTYYVVTEVFKYT